jgi:hypothetical protein
VNLEGAKPASGLTRLRWDDLSDDLREALSGKLAGLWGAPSDEEAFNSLFVDQQQALLLFLFRLRVKGLWHVVGAITNLYGRAGVGIEFTPCPVIESTLSRRKDFTRFLARHKDTSGGYYEKGRAEAALHFLHVDDTSKRWYVHFDLYSPVHSPRSAFKHIVYEVIGKVRPDWRIIQQRLKS